MELTVSPLPTLTESDKVCCTFGETVHSAQLKDGVIICDPPDIIPPTPKHQGKEILLPYMDSKRKEHILLFLMLCSYMRCLRGGVFSSSSPFSQTVWCWAVSLLKLFLLIYLQAVAFPVLGTWNRHRHGVREVLFCVPNKQTPVPLT